MSQNLASSVSDPKFILYPLYHVLLETEVFFKTFFKAFWSTYVNIGIFLISVNLTFPTLLNHILDTLDQFLMNCSWKKSITSQTNPVVKVKYWTPCAKRSLLASLHVCYTNLLSDIVTKNIGSHLGNS